MNKAARALNIDDLARLARRRLPKGLYDFVARGAEDEVTLHENAASLRRVLLRQRVGVDVSARDISTTVFGQKLAMPLGIAVTGLASLIHHDGERKLARAAAAAGIPFTIGSSNFTAQAELLPIAGDLLWRQVYPLANDRLFAHQIGLSRELGIKVLQVTMDSPVIGNREYIRRSGWAPGAIHAGTLLDMACAPRWLFGTLLRYLLTGGLPEIGDMPAGERKFWGVRTNSPSLHRASTGRRWRRCAAHGTGCWWPRASPPPRTRAWRRSAGSTGLSFPTTAAAASTVPWDRSRRCLKSSMRSRDKSP